MDRQVRHSAEIGSVVVDTKTYLPLVAVKNGGTVQMFSEGFIDLSNVPSLHVPDSRFDCLVKFYELESGATIDATPFKAIKVDAGRTELDIGINTACFVEATLIIKENL